MKDLSFTFPQEPMSLCYCGHTGDGCSSDHQPKNEFDSSSNRAPGHGPCTLCDCHQFTWERFINPPKPEGG